MLAGIPADDTDKLVAMTVPPKVECSVFNERLRSECRMLGPIHQRMLPLVAHVCLSLCIGEV
jgi:hypothetical protein